jgi:uncharacterized membrane protein YdjX (TVP38/TMEM64 family)
VSGAGRSQNVIEKSYIKKAILVVIIIGAIAAFRIFHLADYLTLAYLKEARNALAGLYVDRPVSVIAVYMLAYIVVTSLSLPGASVMTLAGGAFLGLFTGTIVVSFASTAGATIACFVSRFILRDWVQSKFGDKLTAVDEGMEREGAFYLFTLRLIPVFPFWLINLVMGLTKMPLKTFYWVSQAGMLPGTIVYVNAGRELAKINSMSDILSPGLVLSFAALGLFPVAAKKILALYRAKRAKR